MCRLLCVLLSVAIAGCAGREMPINPTGSQLAASNAMKPAESVTAYVAFKNDASREALFSVLWSYAVHPLWHEEAASCVRPGAEWHTRVVYNLDGKLRHGPQIRFVANRRCDWRSFKNDKAVSFYGIRFDPDAHFSANFRDFPSDRLCARGGGNNEACDPK